MQSYPAFHENILIFSHPPLVAYSAFVAFTRNRVVAPCFTVRFSPPPPVAFLTGEYVSAEPRKAPVVGASEKTENHMRLITRFELASRSEPELRGLYRQIFNQMACLPCNSQERENALDSLQNIQNELASRRPLP